MTSYDPAWLDAQYDARAASPEHPAIFARWSEASADARARLHGEIDLRYGRGPLQTLDWFPASDANAPVLVFLHGGYWRGSDKSLYSFLAPAFVRTGATVAVPNYDLCPSVTIDAIVREIEEALDWIAARAPRASSLVVSGHSAGGHLAACMLVRQHPVPYEAGDGRDASGPTPMRAGLGISGLYDLEPIRQVPFLAADLRLDGSTAEELSPVKHQPAPGAVFHAFVGGDESGEFLRQSEQLMRSWGASVVPVCERIAGRRHFDVLDALADPQARVFRSAAALLFR